MKNVFFLAKNFVGASVKVTKAPVIIIAPINCVFVEISAFFVCIFLYTFYVLCFFFSYFFFFFFFSLAITEFVLSDFDVKYSLFLSNIVFLVHVNVVKEPRLVIVWFYLFLVYFFYVFPCAYCLTFFYFYLLISCTNIASLYMFVCNIYFSILSFKYVTEASDKWQKSSKTLSELLRSVKRYIYLYLSYVDMFSKT